MQDDAALNQTVIAIGSGQWTAKKGDLDMRKKMFASVWVWLLLRLLSELVNKHAMGSEAFYFRPLSTCNDQWIYEKH